MILWLILFALVVAISFILAAQSMRDFHQIPSLSEYSLFLIRKINALDRRALTSFYEECLKSNSTISFERLIKGHKSALVIFGLGKLMDKFKNTFDLLELEDYTSIPSEQVSAWEVGVKKGEVIEDASLPDGQGKLFEGLPPFQDTEQLWWQIVIKPKKMSKDQNKYFQAQIRMGVISQDLSRRKKITDAFLQNLKANKLSRIPKSFSDAQIMDFYQTRSFRKSDNNPSLTLDEILQLLTVL